MKLSAINRLVRELSWFGAQVVNLRDGGLRDENVLTTEVLMGLDLLPRRHFLGVVLEDLHDCPDDIRDAVVSETEDFELTLLPGDMYLQEPVTTNVQPDAVLSTRNAYILVEAKRINGGSFQPEQIVREALLAQQEAQGRRSLLILILDADPPIKVQGGGKLSIEHAVHYAVQKMSDRTGSTDIMCPEGCIAWTTWPRIAEIIERQLLVYHNSDASTEAAVGRIAQSIIAAIRNHSDSYASYVASKSKSTNKLPSE